MTTFALTQTLSQHSTAVVPRVRAQADEVRRATAHDHTVAGAAVRVRTRTRLTRRGRIVLAMLVVLPLLIGGGALAANAGAAASVAGSASASFHHVTVRAGDSLWSIAERIAPQSDPRDVVGALVDLNGLQTSVVQAGQQLAVPHVYDARR